MYKSRGSLNPSDLPNPDAHLLPPVQEVERDVTCVATGKIIPESDAIQVDGKWVSKAHLSKLVEHFDDVERFSYKIFKGVDKSFEGEFDLDQFNENLKAMNKALIKLAVEANKIGGGK